MSLRAIVQGKEGNLVSVPKASHKTLNVILMASADGGLVALGAGTVDCLFYTLKNRTVAATATIAATVVTAAEGKCTLGLTPGNLTFGPGDYYMYTRFTLSGVLKWSDEPSIIRIG